jgi:transposase
MLHVVKNGVAWRNLPRDSPNWRTVCHHCQKSGASGIDKALRFLVSYERAIEGRKKNASMIIIDSKSVENADTATEKWCDGGKKCRASRSAFFINI